MLKDLLFKRTDRWNRRHACRDTRHCSVRFHNKHPSTEEVGMGGVCNSTWCRSLSLCFIWGTDHRLPPGPLCGTGEDLEGPGRTWGDRGGPGEDIRLTAGHLAWFRISLHITDATHPDQLALKWDASAYRKKCFVGFSKRNLTLPDQ